MSTVADLLNPGNSGEVFAAGGVNEAGVGAPELTKGSAEEREKWFTDLSCFIYLLKKIP